MIFAAGTFKSHKYSIRNPYLHRTNFTMKLLLSAVCIIATSLAFPSPHAVTGDAPDVIQLVQVVPDTAASCQPGLTYCFGQIVEDLRVNKQTILHQYCDQQFEYDAQSCHACKKWPWPLDYCWDGPSAWNSVFECKGEQEYTFKTRCSWCEAGKCV
ncbi:hypothetical protein EK21DRAFT_79777 [Setomelanomma holmii]|uniref:Uncharacterized protein n=1 Tax=Setomelanomma holmii TaxID=210430 RepID=A0A9P4GXT4_9PLEO|nr:hypothetical protein EK21DRAFT_79777 [Setomelanomma holmii]